MKSDARKKQMDNITSQEANSVVGSNVERSVSPSGARMDVPHAQFRFPPVDGIQQSVALVCNKTGNFMNIGFQQGVENAISGNMADKILNSFPGLFEVTKLNGRPYSRGIKNIEEDLMEKRIMEKLSSKYDITPKKDTSKGKRDRPSEAKASEAPSTAAKGASASNSFTKE